METKKAIQISFVILMIESGLALIYGLSAFIIPEVFVSRSFSIYTGQTWDNLINESPKIANYILILEGMAGGLGFTAVLGSLFVLLTVFKKGEKWAWFYVLVCGIIAWGNNLIANMLMKNFLIVIIIALGFLLLTFGLILSAKAFLIERGNH